MRKPKASGQPWRHVPSSLGTHAPFGPLEPLAVLKTNPDGAGIAQAIGPLKTLAAGNGASTASRSFVIVTDLKDPSQVVLRQAGASNGQ